MKKKSIFFENGFKLTDEKMKTIVGGTVPPGSGNCQFTGYSCGPAGAGGGCDSYWTDTVCCCSIEGPAYNQQCYVGN